MLDSFWYLASPYTRYGGGIEDAFQQAARARALLVKHGVPAFSPITHSHAAAMHGGLDALDHSMWMRDNRPFMRAAHGLIVLRLNGWMSSDGVTEEIDAFRAARKPLIFMDPGRVPEELVVGVSHG